LPRRYRTCVPLLVLTGPILCINLSRNYCKPLSLAHACTRLPFNCSVCCKVICIMQMPPFSLCQVLQRIVGAETRLSESWTGRATALSTDYVFGGRSSQRKALPLSHDTKAAEAEINPGAQHIYIYKRSLECRLARRLSENCLSSFGTVSAVTRDRVIRQNVASVS
jgi:hypothetical protein